MDINHKLDKLFEEWESESRKRGFDGFCRDGLMYNGLVIKDGEKPIRIKKSESEEWLTSPLKIMFLAKEMNSHPNYDVRNWDFINRERFTIGSKFFRGISYWLAGISHVNATHSIQSFEEMIELKQNCKAIDNTPFCYVNLKKESGTARSSMPTIEKYTKENSEFLKKQIREILSPKLIICCGGTGSIRVASILRDIIYNLESFEKFGDWISYSQKRNLVVIDSYHPTYTGISERDMYYGICNEYQKFLTQSN